MEKIREESLSVRLDTAEREHVEKESERYGISKSCFIRRLIEKDITDSKKIFLSREERLALKMLSNELNRIGTNINQIVHRNNMGYYSDEEKHFLIGYLKQSEKILEKIQSMKGGSV